MKLWMDYVRFAPAGHQETIVNENQLVEMMMMMTVETSCETS